jgi:uncharacterized protein YjiS (DUF1127 family)
MSQSISSKSNSFRMHVRAESSLGWACDLLLAGPRALLRATRRAWSMHCEQKLLQELSDYQLRDLGIRRDQIESAVRNGWDV